MWEDDENPYDEFLNEFGPTKPDWYDEVRELLMDGGDWNTFDNFMLRYLRYKSIKQYLMNYVDVVSIATDIMEWAIITEDYEFCKVMQPVLDRTNIKYEQTLALELWKEDQEWPEDWFDNE